MHSTDIGEGRKDDSGKVQIELVPPELIFAVADILTFGAKKYTTTELSNFWNLANVEKLDLFIAGVYAASVTKSSSGKITLSTPKDKGRTLETGGLIIQKESVLWQEIELLIQKSVNETRSLNSLTTFVNLVYPNFTIKNSWEEAVQSVDQGSSCTLITTTRQGNSEVFCVANTTTVSDSLVITLRGLNQHSDISKLTPKSGERNWEKGMVWSRVYGALMRHLWTWWARGGVDPETGKSHLWHAACCITFLLTYEIRQSGTDDRPEGHVFE